MDFNQIMGQIALFYVPFLFALCFHEFAHSWVANRLGDSTAKDLGRLSMNPLVHMDLMGTVIFPLFAIVGGSPLFFGWAKPVPVSIQNLKNPKKDMFWIALAGPASNFILAIIGLILINIRLKLGLSHNLSDLILQLLRMFVYLNLFLAVFNMIPVHPLDGGKILARFLPIKTNIWLEQNSQIISMVLFGFIILDSLSSGQSFVALPIKILYNILAATIGFLFMPS